MPQRDTVDFVAAFALGALLGAVSALLLRPSAPTRTDRVMRWLRRNRRRSRGLGARSRTALLAQSLTTSARLGQALGVAGRELGDALRGEITDAWSGARNRIAPAAASTPRRAAQGRGAG